MKTFRTICLALAALAIIKVTLHAAADPTSLYKAGEVQVQAIAFTDTDGFRSFDSGGGVAGSYWFTKNIGLGLEAKTLDTDHAFFDTLGANIAARFPLGNSGLAPFGRVGFDWNAEVSSNPQTRNEFDLYVGCGIEKRFKNGIGISVEARILRDCEFQQDERFQFLAGVSKSF